MSRLKDTGCKIICPNNKIFIHFGEFANGMYLLYKGKANARVMSLQGNKLIIFTMKPLCTFGEAPFLNNHKSNLEIEVHSGSVLYYFDNNCIKYLTEESSLFKDLIIKSIMLKAQISVDHLLDIYNLSPEQRVSKSLYHLCIDHGIKTSDNKYILNISQEDIATFSGLSRVTVARIYSKLRDNDILSKSYKSKRNLTVSLEKLSKYIDSFPL